MGARGRKITGEAADTADAPMFELLGVRKHYGDSIAVDGISLAFARGVVTALIGSSGSGKSTLLRLLTGLLRPDAGEVRFDGCSLDAATLRQARQRMGYVIQEGGLFPHRTVLGNLSLLPVHLGWSGARVLERARELAVRVQLPEALLQRYPSELSGGQRQRVALMRALMLDPPVLLLDEPLGALDPIVRSELQEQLADMFAELDKTVLLVTHDVAEAAWLASRLVLLRDGRVEQDGSFAQLRQSPASTHVRRFLASARSLPEAP